MALPAAANLLKRSNGLFADVRRQKPRDPQAMKICTTSLTLQFCVSSRYRPLGHTLLLWLARMVDEKCGSDEAMLEVQFQLMV